MKKGSKKRGHENVQGNLEDGPTEEVKRRKMAEEKEKTESLVTILSFRLRTDSPENEPMDTGMIPNHLEICNNGREHNLPDNNVDNEPSTSTNAQSRSPANPENADPRPDPFQVNTALFVDRLQRLRDLSGFADRITNMKLKNENEKPSTSGKTAPQKSEPKKTSKKIQKKQPRSPTKKSPTKKSPTKKSPTKKSPTKRDKSSLKSGKDEPPPKKALKDKVQDTLSCSIPNGNSATQVSSHPVYQSPEDCVGNDAVTNNSSSNQQSSHTDQPMFHNELHSVTESKEAPCYANNRAKSLHNILRRNALSVSSIKNISHLLSTFGANTSNISNDNLAINTSNDVIQIHSTMSDCEVEEDISIEIQNLSISVSRSAESKSFIRNIQDEVLAPYRVGSSPSEISLLHSSKSVSSMEVDPQDDEILLQTTPSPQVGAPSTDQDSIPAESHSTASSSPCVTPTRSRGNFVPVILENDQLVLLTDSSNTENLTTLESSFLPTNNDISTDVQMNLLNATIAVIGNIGDLLRNDVGCTQETCLNNNETGLLALAPVKVVFETCGCSNCCLSIE